MKRESFVMVHVGQSAQSRRNLRFGIDTRSWGFPVWKPEFRSAHPRFAVLATGAGPRAGFDIWRTGRITLCLCEVREGFYEGEAPHWPDEEADNAVKYPARFGIEPLAVIHEVSLGEDGPLSSAASDAIRLSGIERGIGRLCDLDPQPLLDAMDIKADWARQQEIPLGNTPGIDAEWLDSLSLPKTSKALATSARSKTSKASKGRHSGAGFVSDPKKRKAIELHAEDMAVADYERQGWTVERIGKPYDLHCTRAREERRVEVKGTTGAATSVELTINEVEHARNPRHTVDLYVVSDITVGAHSSDYATSGGRVTHVKDWFPADEDLRARRFEYRLPLAD
ncbi:protein NO VEIN domain-containing protein [Streptomyces sp. 3213.3]|uniref:protein NO VEIN domain-containing protein n=1 Tax=Streptomyces sp. 3213.3 TaxID=1855348 RepID=UPI001F2AED25|nr:DUF3883 domain-containing protein [Streptomyces sp. 3213.3]